MKKTFILLIILTMTTIAHSSEKYFFNFKPNENLKYKIQINPLPDEIGYSLGMKLTNSISESSIVTMVIKENENNTLKYSLKLKFFNTRSCCNPLTYPGYVYTINSEIENVIKPSGEYIQNEKNYVSMGCILGFNLFKIKPGQPKNYKPIIIPFYFPEKEISVGESWNNKFEYEDEDKTHEVFINYSLKSIISNIAYIDGYNLQGLHITSQFDIKKGCWIDFKMFQIKDSKDYLFKSFELTE